MATDKSYHVDDRRRGASLNACEGLPTEWLERGLVKELYSSMALLILADKLGERGKDGSISFPAAWWNAHVRGAIDCLNLIADPKRRN